MAAFVAMAAATMVYPFLPGRHDPVAVPLSAVVQVFAGGSLLLVPVGVLWLACEIHRFRQRKRGKSEVSGRRGFALVSLVIFGFVSAIAALAASAVAGYSLSIPLAGLSALAAVNMWRRARVQKPASPDAVPPAPLWMILAPLALLAVQLGAARPLTDYSRQRAITRSAEMIQAIEQYRARQGGYPATLEAVWRDYSPSVTGIDRFRYVSQGNSFLLLFEQPRFLFDDFGVREFVVYSPDDQHRIVSHDSWILLLSPEEMERNPGWHATRPTMNPRWWSFHFD